MKTYIFRQYEEETSESTAILHIALLKDKRNNWYCLSTESRDQINRMIHKSKSCTSGEPFLMHEDETLNQSETIKVLRSLGAERIEPIYSIYIIERCYGGPEEGGWWYDNWIYSETLSKKEFKEYQNNELRLVDNCRLVAEIMKGENETEGKPHYC